MHRNNNSNKWNGSRRKKDKRKFKAIKLNSLGYLHREQPHQILSFKCTQLLQSTVKWFAFKCIIYLEQEENIKNKNMTTKKFTTSIPYKFNVYTYTRWQLGQSFYFMGAFPIVLFYFSLLQSD